MVTAREDASAPSTGISCYATIIITGPVASDQNVTDILEASPTSF